MLLLNKRIFIIDDNVADRKIMQILLEKEFAKTLCSGSGVEALPCIHAFLPVHLILFNVAALRMESEYELWAALHTHPELSQIPMIGVSALAPQKMIPLCKAKGMKGFIPKPFNYLCFAMQITSMLYASATGTWITTPSDKAEGC